MLTVLYGVHDAYPNKKSHVNLNTQKIKKKTEVKFIQEHDWHILFIKTVHDSVFFYIFYLISPSIMLQVERCSFTRVAVTSFKKCTKMSLSSIFCCPAVLWLPLSAAEHDAGLCSNWNLSTGHSPEPYRLQGQGVFSTVCTVLPNMLMHTHCPLY